MGMMPATQVPDTFLLRDVEATENLGAFQRDESTRSH